MKFIKPITVEINLEEIIEKIDDSYKPKLIEIMISSVMQKGITKEIRDIVNNPGYDD